MTKKPIYLKKFIFLYFLFTITILAESGDLTKPQKKEPEPAAGVSLKELQAERKSLQDRLLNLQTEQAKVILIWKSELEILESEISKMKFKITDSAQEISGLEEIKTKLLKKLKDGQESLKLLEMENYELKRMLEVYAQSILSLYNNLPGILKQRAECDKALKATENLSPQLLMEKLLLAEKELQHFDSGVWSGFENFKIGGIESRVKVLYMGIVTGTWLSLDENRAGVLTYTSGEWVALPFPSSFDIRMIRENFHRAEQQDSFYLPFIMSKNRND